jgi:hypothetical protein
MNAVQQEFNNALMLVALQSLLTSPFYTVGKMATLGDVMDSIYDVGVNKRIKQIIEEAVEESKTDSPEQAYDRAMGIIGGAK